METKQKQRSPTLWMALVVFLTISVINAQDHTDQPVERLRPQEESDKPMMFYDSDKGLAMYVDQTRGVCLFYPPKPEQVYDAVLRQYLEQHPRREAPSRDAVLTPHDEEIADRSVLGDAVRTLCHDKKVFWLYPDPQLEAGAQDNQESGSAGETRSREKRQIFRDDRDRRFGGFSRDDRDRRFGGFSRDDRDRRFGGFSRDDRNRGFFGRQSPFRRPGRFGGFGNSGFQGFIRRLFSRFGGGIGK